jgi:hypothetical protein
MMVICCPFNSENDKQAFEVLQVLSKTNRFQVTMMLLSNQDKDVIYELFAKFDGNKFENFQSVARAYRI